MDIGSTRAESQTQGSQTHSRMILLMSDPKNQHKPRIMAAIGTRLLLGGEGALGWRNACLCPEADCTAFPEHPGLLALVSISYCNYSWSLRALWCSNSSRSHRSVLKSKSKCYVSVSGRYNRSQRNRICGRRHAARAIRPALWLQQARLCFSCPCSAWGGTDAGCQPGLPRLREGAVKLHAYLMFLPSSGGFVPGSSESTQD